MSIKGQSFTGGAAGAHIEFGAGTAAALYAGAWSIAVLYKSSIPNFGLFGGWNGATGSGTERGGYHQDGGGLFGVSDFSGGFGSGLGNSTWRWAGVCKAAGSALMQWHLAPLSGLSWSHGPSPSNPTNIPNTGNSDRFSVGYSAAPMGFDQGDIAAAVVWAGLKLTDGQYEAACTAAAADLLSVTPSAGWLFPQATSGSSIADFTGGGADETTRVDIATSADPPGFDFTLVVPPAEGQAAFSLALALAGTGARASRGAAALGLPLALAGTGRSVHQGAAAFGLPLALATTGRRASQGAAALGLALHVDARGPVSNVRPSKITARGRSAATRARGSSEETTARGGYADA